MVEKRKIVPSESEGGCGVIGLACEEKIQGKHLLPPLMQMRNRGNGKGGGIAAVGLSAWSLIVPYLEENERLFGVSKERLLQYEAETLKPNQIYRKIVPAKTKILQEEEAWVKGRS